MIGDDIESDIGGAMNVGLKGILVRQGKYRKQDEEHETYTPNFVADDLLEAAKWIESHNNDASNWEDVIGGVLVETGLL